MQKIKKGLIIIYKIISLILVFVLTIIPLTYTQANAGNVRYTASIARSILRAVANLEDEKMEYDLDNNGVITANDARIALRKAARLPEDGNDTIYSSAIISQEKTYQQIGVLSTCKLSKDQLQSGLSGNLKQYAELFLRAESEYNVNAVFLSAVAALESGWGGSWLAKNKNNLFGWKSGKSYKYFSSVEECIFHVAKYLRINYLTPGGCYFNGYDVRDISINYCNSNSWASQVVGIMGDIYRKSKS